MAGIAVNPVRVSLQRLTDHIGRMVSMPIASPQQAETIHERAMELVRDFSPRSFEEERHLRRIVEELDGILVRGNPFAFMGRMSNPLIDYLGPYIGERSARPLETDATPPTTKLTRIPVASADLQDTRVRLAVDAEAALGYRPLLQEMKLPGRLARALAELEIEPFDNAAVAAYKEEMRRWKQSEINKRFNQDQEKLRDDHSAGRRTVTLCKWSTAELAGYSKPVPEFVLQKCLQIKSRVPDVVFHVDELRENETTLDPFMIATEKDASLFEVDRSFIIEVWDEPKFESSVIDK